MYRSISILLLLIIVSCKNDVATPDTKKNPDITFPEATNENTRPAYVATNQSDKPIQEPKSTYEETKVPTGPELRAQGESIYTKRMAEKAQPIAALDVSKWGYDGEFVSGKFAPAAEVDGRWLDFSEKWTYTYGDKSGKKGSGKYHYNNDNKLLLILDDNKSIKPQEFKIKIVNDALVLMGQATYADGGYQAKLTRVKNQ